MWKWWHRGVVALLLLVTVTATLVAVIPARKIRIYPLDEGRLRGYGGTNEIIVSIQSNALVTVRARDYKSELYSGDYTHRACGILISAKREGFSGVYHPSGIIYNLIMIDAWLIAIFTAIYPAIFFIRAYRRRRLRRQVMHPCDRCGYDLQGNESGVCPECGTVVRVGV